jgi:hypothetical protein
MLHEPSLDLVTRALAAPNRFTDPHQGEQRRYREQPWVSHRFRMNSDRETLTRTITLGVSVGNSNS